jgi:hypothetical protein
MSEIDFAEVFSLPEPIATPGYVVVDEEQILFVPGQMDLAGVPAYIGYPLDGDAGALGDPVFLHKKMEIRRLGSLDDYIADPFVDGVLPRVVQYFEPEQGALPLIAVVEALRVDPTLDVEALAKAVLERRQAMIDDVKAKMVEEV